MRILNQEVKLTKAAVEKLVKSEQSKSAKMKELFKSGLTVKEIATIMDVRYNFVYNVISNFVNMNGIETFSEGKGESKKDKIVELFNQGKTNKEISIELKTNYNYVFNVLKEYKAKVQESQEG